MRVTSTLAVFVVSLASAQVVLAQANLPLYTNNLVNSFQDWSFNCTRNFTNNTPVTNGTHSISVTMTSSGYGALALQFPAGFNSAPYASLSFWISGGSSGGQHVKVAGTVVSDTVVSSYTLPALTANTWQQFTIPLSTLGVANTSSCSGIWIQNTTSGSEPVFYVDDIQFNAAPAPALVHLNVNAASVVRTVDARQFGVNTATWDGYLGNSQTIPLLQEMGCLTLRWPGGSTSDYNYHWASGL